MLFERKRRPDNKIGLISIISAVFLIGIIYANWASRKIYTKYRRSSITARRLRDLSHIQPAFEAEPKSLNIYVPYAPNITFRKWIDDIPRQMSKVSYSTCPVCRLGTLEPGANSNKRDVIITSMITGEQLNPYLIRSIRSVNCQARIVIFATPLNMKFLEHLQDSFLTPCDVQIINVGDIRPRYEKNLNIVNHIIYSYFLSKFEEEIDRVIIVSASSTIFQADPFTVRWNNTVFGLTKLGDAYDDDLCEMMSRIDPQRDYTKQIPLSDRLIYGSIDGMLRFYSIIFAHEHFRSAVLPNSTMTGYINWFWANDYFQSAGFNPAVTNAFVCVGNQYNVSVAVKSGRGNVVFSIGESTPMAFDMGKNLLRDVKFGMTDACELRAPVHRTPNITKRSRIRRSHRASSRKFHRK